MLASFAKKIFGSANDRLVASLDREVRATFDGEKIRHQRPITLEVHGRPGTPLTLIANDGLGHVVQAVDVAPDQAQRLALAEAPQQGHLARFVALEVRQQVGEHGLEAVAVTEWDEPQAVIGSNPQAVTRSTKAGSACRSTS